MGYSIQDINTRLLQVEDKLDFMMRQFRVTKKIPKLVQAPGELPWTVHQMSLLDAYRELKASAAQIEQIEDSNGTSE
jgi:hypothetical protein